MPRIAPEILGCVFYLYPTVDDARKGKNAGGTGFFFSMPLGDLPGHYYYAITNWHNIFKGRGAPVIRVNTKNGKPDIFELDHLDWAYKPRWHDLAVADITLDMEKDDVSFVASDLVVTESDMLDWNIGLGSDVFMVGRFIDHDGGEINVPAARFGNISVMPQPIPQETRATNLPSYILDIHSRPGFSGSPVFVFHNQTKTEQGGMLTAANPHHWMKLLGVHWGQFPERWEIRAEDRQLGEQEQSDLSDAAEPPRAEYVKGFSGMTLAVPASAIMELLDIPRLREPREKAFAAARARGA